MKSQAGRGAVFSCTLWSANRRFANGGWHIGILVRGTDKEAATFQRYFVPKRPPPPVTGSFIFPRFKFPSLSRDVFLLCRSGQAPSAGVRCFPQPITAPPSAAEPFHPQLCVEILVAPTATVHPLLMWMTREPGLQCQLQRQVKVLLVKLLQPFLLPGTMAQLDQALPHTCFECLEQCCLNAVGCTPQMLERGPIWPSDFPLQSNLFM